MSNENEVALNQGPRRDDGVGSNPELRAQRRRWFPWQPPLNRYLSYEPLSYGEVTFWVSGWLYFVIGGCLRW